MSAEVGQVLVDSHRRGAGMYMTVPESSFDPFAYRRRADEMVSRASQEVDSRYRGIASVHGDEMTAILYLLFLDADADDARRIDRGLPARIARLAAYHGVPRSQARRAHEIVSEDDAARDLLLSVPSRSRLFARTEARRALNLGVVDAALSEGRDPSLADPVRPFERETTYPLWEIREIMDHRTRGNPNGDFPEGSHWQVNGYIETMERIVAQNCVPPCGWNCRAALVPVAEARAGRLGLLREDGTVDRAALEAYNSARQPYIDARLYPDPGFR
jgi:hypothetical protein